MEMAERNFHLLVYWEKPQCTKIASVLTSESEMTCHNFIHVIFDLNKYIDRYMNLCGF